MSGFVAVPAQGSVEVWFKSTSLSDVGFIGWLDGTANGTMMLYSAGGLSVSFYAGTAETTAVVTVNDGAWHHAVGTYDGTDGRLYVDGDLVAGPTALTHTAGTSANSFKLGVYSGGPTMTLYPAVSGRRT